MPNALTIPAFPPLFFDTITLERPQIEDTVLGRILPDDLSMKLGLDIQGGTQVTLRADMSAISEADRPTALSAAQEVLLRRVDLYGVNEPLVQTSRTANEYRIIVELAGVDDPAEALALIGTTAQLDFRLASDDLTTATTSADAFFGGFVPTDLTGKDLSRATVNFDPQTNEPIIALQFTPDGRKKFADITGKNVNKVLGIFLDGFPLMLPVINQAIMDGEAVITGGFSLEEAKNLSIQLNAGALPVPIQVIEQRTIGASLGQEAVARSVEAGVIGIGLVMVLMIALYGWSGLIANLALSMYAVYTVALYKLLGVTITLPGIAGLLLTIGMAVDANILIFERMKEELRAGKPFEVAMKQGFGRAWDSIKDANIATIFVSLVLINPLDISFLNTSGLVRGFGITLLIGVVVSLFTGVVVTRTLMLLFLKERAREELVRSE